MISCPPTYLKTINYNYFVGRSIILADPDPFVLSQNRQLLIKV